ncbi:beta subunit of fatty acid synthase [Periconia macrospinosa]|uniref:Beta subunit of fatty acid synthase n=1 Tax=Periconia macrospinosa TaxID=97972 RepID=A0A2V1DYK5_9PLEO|nr:beta subunit of fatty acid synthase [Periconia macrospinosa]
MLVYGPLVRELMNIALVTLETLMSRPETSAFYELHDIHIFDWLRPPYPEVELAYLALAPVSVPLNGLVSLCHYCIACKSLGLLPGELLELLGSITGHSQGIVVADAIARSTSWEDFYSYARVAIEMLFWVGFECHHEEIGTSLSKSEIKDSVESGEGKPSPMLAVRGLTEAKISTILTSVNRNLQPQHDVHIALVNSKENIIIAGPPKSLLGLNLHLRKIKAAESTDQSRLLFRKRKPVVDHQFLPISAPFHSPYLKDATARILASLSHLKLPSSDLRVPLYHTGTGEDLSRSGSSNITETLIRMVTVDRVNWPKTISHMTDSYVLDFGPGGIGALIHTLLRGAGTRVILASALSSMNKKIGAKAELFSSVMRPSAPNWAQSYRPRLIKGSQGRTALETKMTACMGVKPIMVAGMTPTTVHWDFVAAVTKAGYHVELAGGGYHNAPDMEAAIRKIANSIPPEASITCNLLYVSPRAMAWQIPLIRRLVQEGLPIDGLTIGAGVPSLDKAKEYVETLGLRHISFKPGSEQAIMDVLTIAKSFPKFTFGLQWTGGRGGGHHSFEDFHEPLIKTYGAIRECPNIVLIAGSGFGDSKSIYPYITGDWSKALGYHPMPIDGVLLGSRMMVAKEAHTSHGAKQLLIGAEGVSDSQWYDSYDKPVGGVITVTSEMGQPIHKLATRGVLLWREFDEKFFSIKDQSKRLAVIKKNRNYIIERLNCDFQKPWFGLNAGGENVDVEDMTYLEIVSRLIDLTYIKFQDRWVHASYEKLLIDFINRACERLPGDSTFDPHYGADPAKLLEAFKQSYPSAETEYLHPDDVSFFFGVCRRRGQKPVNFIPALDQNFETWFKKDSLWQSEDIDAVLGRDPQRTCIIQGPVAVQHCKSVDETSQDILDGIQTSIIERLTQDKYEIEESVTGFLSPTRKFGASSCLRDILVEESRGQLTLAFPSVGPLPEVQRFWEELHNMTHGWAQACLTDPTIQQGSQRRTNPIQAAFSPDRDSVIRIVYTVEKKIEAISLETKSGKPVIKMKSPDGLRISLMLYAQNPVAPGDICLELGFQFLPGGNACRIFEDLSRRNKRIKNFYSELWLGKRIGSLAASGVHREFSSGQMRIELADVRQFQAVIEASAPDQLVHGHQRTEVPIDYCIVLAWDAVVKPLLISSTDGDLLRLLHRSNEFAYCEGAEILRIGDEVETIARIGAINNQAGGKTIEVLAEIRRRGQPVVNITSSFFIRGTFDDYAKTFTFTEEPEMAIEVDSEKTAALLQSRSWLDLAWPASDLIGAALLFKVNTQATYDKSGSYTTLQVTGQVFLTTDMEATTKIGEVYFEAGTCHGNPVTDFLARHGTLTRRPVPLRNPGWRNPSEYFVRIPKNTKAYAKISKDSNPIHLTPAFARYAGLDKPVTHGMFTSAAVRNMVEQIIAESDATRFRRWSASFDDVVYPGDVLRLEIKHVSMLEGRIVVEVKAYNTETDVKVLEAKAEVDQAPTAYMFTGQGSQEKGMGMSLYEVSPAAKSIWDLGDKHLMNLYGFSILDIVQNDVKEVTVHFGGIRGRQLRNNYLAMKTKKTSPTGDIVEACMLEDLTPYSTCHTFRDERGLLFSTQFAQPAIVLMELAAYEDLKSKGLVQQNAPFAGHSLGEYAALGTIAGVLSVESLLSLVFYRGLAMQVAMKRDAQGNSGFSMVAVNPSRVSKSFDQKQLEDVVALIGRETRVLLEIVNYNVEGQQYVCAGHLRALWVLTQTLNRLHEDHKTTSSQDEIANLVLKILTQCPDSITDIQLSRGVATIPLNGIDVPFHSTYLRSGISIYREYLEEKILKENVDPQKLVGKFIPNVMGKPFSVDKEFVREVAECTGSAAIRELLDKWN